MIAGVPSGINAEILLALGVVCLSAAAAMWIALAVAALTDTNALGVAAGTILTAVVYVLVTEIGLPLTVFAPPALAVTAGVIVAAAVVALVRVSRAEL